MADQAYVSTAAWLHPTGRTDHVDEIADQFERPAPHDSATVDTDGRWTHPAQPLTVGPARSIVKRMTTRRSRAMAAR